MCHHVAKTVSGLDVQVNSALALRAHGHFQWHHEGYDV
jgi:hypothetical protein